MTVYSCPQCQVRMNFGEKGKWVICPKCHFRATEDGMNRRIWERWYAPKTHKAVRHGE